MEKELVKEFIEQSIYRLDESIRMLQISLEPITEEELWEKPNESSNSIGNLLLHLCGNIGQYIISSLGENPDLRDRDKEFETFEGYAKEELWQRLSMTIKTAKEIVGCVSNEKLIKKHEVQGFHLSGIGIIIHAVEHLSYHTGQIAFWAKQLKNRDLGFYKGQDLNIKNN